MAFYDRPKQERLELVETIGNSILADIQNGDLNDLPLWFNDEDTYVRKYAYQLLGAIYLKNKNLRKEIIRILDHLLLYEEYKIRQTVINTAGEIGKHDFQNVSHIFDKSLFDKHHAGRNAVIGSIKKMAEVNPLPVLSWAKRYLHHENKEIRREICHGIELRGRTYPQDILPMLKELQFDKIARVRQTLVHVIGQIAYKKDCLQTVIEDLQSWENKELVYAALKEIADVHHRYKNFAALTHDEAREYILSSFPQMKIRATGLNKMIKNSA